jgi:pyruvate dehydrogenase E1 component
MTKPYRQAEDIDPQETREWKEALEEVIERDGPERAHFLLEALVCPTTPPPPT